MLFDEYQLNNMNVTFKQYNRIKSHYRDYDDHNNGCTEILLYIYYRSCHACSQQQATEGSQCDWSQVQ